jgi:uncharacterized membrane protein (DUF2068 family)
LSGPAAQAPLVSRGTEIRSKVILRLFAIERFIRAVVAVAAAYALWHFHSSQLSMERTFDRKLPLVRDLFRQLGFNIDHSKFVGLLQRALTLSSGTLTLVAAGLALYAAIELVEGVGLWLAKRWGEYFALIATSLGLPVEIYDISHKITVTASVLFALNLVLVLYLVLTKRLFGARGGKKAYDARLKSESVLEAAVRSAAAAKPAPDKARASGAVGAVGALAQPAAADAPVARGRITDK